MINNKSILAIITARGGSKGLPRKNILPADNEPLINWTINAAKHSQFIDRIILSSDDDEIMSVARDFGCDVPFRRPKHLSDDRASSSDVIVHALTEVPNFDYFIVLQPTSPLRTASDIDSALSLMCDQDADSCVSVCAADESPYWMYELENNQRMTKLLHLPENITRRQDLPLAYILNGAIYIAKTNDYLNSKTIINPNTVAYTMPSERSIDIDTKRDFELFCYDIKNKKYSFSYTSYNNIH